MKECSECGKGMEKDDKYCRYCGNEYDGGKFEPRNNILSCVYGPPYSAKYVCPECGHRFAASGLGSPHGKYCPKCGKRCEPNETDGFYWD